MCEFTTGAENPPSLLSYLNTPRDETLIGCIYMYAILQELTN